MNANSAAHFDQWFLNLFPRETPFVFDKGGYQTLNFVPALITMTLGLMAGENLRSGKTAGEKLNWLLKAGALCLILALITGTTICPVIRSSGRLPGHSTAAPWSCGSLRSSTGSSTSRATKPGPSRSWSSA
jgi:hypothetical protein